MTDDRLLYGSVRTELSVAVELIDAYTGGRPVGPARVSLAGDVAPLRQGPGVYYVARDLPGVPDPIEIEVETRSYLPETASEDRDDLDDTYPVVSIELLPAPGYGFGAGVTLVRGHVEDASGDPISGAVVTIDGRSDETRCDSDGEFVLWLADLGADEIEVSDDSKRLVEIDGDDPTIRAERADGTTAAEQVELEVGATASVTISI